MNSMVLTALLKYLRSVLDDIKDSTNDDTVKGLLRSIGDAGSTPTNATGLTVLKLLSDIETRVDQLEGYLNSVESYLDGVEGLLTTIDSVLDSIKDIDGIKKITDTVTVEDTPPGAIYEGTKSIAATGTPEAIAGSQALKRGVLVQAKYANTGYVQVGNSSDQHVRLYPGESIYIPIDNLADVYIEVEVAGEDVDYIAS